MLTEVLNTLGGGLAKAIGDVIDDATLSKEERLDAITGLIVAEMKAASDIIIAEAQSDSWMAKNWRPLTMLVFTFIVFNNYILYPYLSLFFDNAPLLELPDRMWSLLQIGLGGYVVGRSGEKIAKAMKG